MLFSQKCENRLLASACRTIAGRRQSRKLVERHYDNAAALEPDPVALLPIAQLLVGAFSRHADHLAERALGHADFPAFGGRLYELDQNDLRPLSEAREIVVSSIVSCQRDVPKSAGSGQQGCYRREIL